MDLIARILGSQKGVFRLSCVVSGLTTVAILWLGLSPVALLVVAWGGAFLLSETRDWVNRRLGRP